MEKLFKRPALIVGIITVLTVFLGLQLPRAELDNNNIRFLPKGNHARAISDYIDDTFGGQVLVLVGLERQYRSVFEKNFLEKIREFSHEVENVEYIKSVNSIMSTQYIYGSGDSIVVSDLVPEDFSGSKEDIAELKRRIASWDLYKNALVSNDLSATQILITLDVMTEDFARPEVTRSIKTVRKIAEKFFADDAQIYFTGQPIINSTINDSIIADNLLLIPMVVIVVLAMLFFSFRRLTFVVLPLLTVIIAVVWTVGASALFGIKLSVLTTILPVILVAVGSAYGIHIVTHYMEDTKNKILTVEEHRSLVLELVKKLIKPVFLAALTTLAGFISFCFTPIVPMQEFGYCAGFGVIVSFVVAVLFIPAVFLLRGPRVLKERQKKKRRRDRLSYVIACVSSVIARKKVLVLFVAVFIAAISVYGLSKIIVDNVIVEFFQKETDMSRSDRFIREYFGGSKDLNMVVQADTAEELLHPDVLQAIDGLSDYLNKQVPLVGKVVGFTDIIKRVNQTVNVDENPLGLQPTAAYSRTDDFGFGDFGSSDEDFGFGNFGNLSDTAGDELAYADSQEHGTANNLSQYTAADFLKFLDNAAGESSNVSGSELVSDLKRLTNYDGMAYYEIPTDPKRYGKETPEELQRLIANYLVLLAGDDDSGYSNDPLEPTAIRTMLQLRTTGNKDARTVIDTIKSYIALNFPKNVRVLLGGGVITEMAVTDLILNSQLISIAISVLIVFLIIAISNKSLAAGIIGSVPLMLAVLGNFAVMGFLGIKLNLGTALIASLAVGIGIDYTIHFIEFFKREYQSGRPNFLRRTFIGCGKAIIINALSVGAGFGVLAFSRFKIIAELGLLIALSMVLTALISLTVIPALLLVFKPKFIYGRKHP